MELTLPQIDDGIDALLDNASRLVSEAETLLSVGAFARSHALAHLAREELSKASMLSATGVRILAGTPIDWKRLHQRLRDHKTKISHELVSNLVDLKMAGGFDLSGDEFSDEAISFVAKVRNDRKNSSLYVNFEEGKFVRPEDVIDAEIAVMTVEIARASLNTEVERRQAMPRFADREIGSVSHLANIEELLATMSHDDIRSLDLGALFFMLREQHTG